MTSEGVRDHGSCFFIVTHLSGFDHCWKHLRYDIFRHFNAGMLHIVALTKMKRVQGAHTLSVSHSPKNMAVLIVIMSPREYLFEINVKDTCSFASNQPETHTEPEKTLSGS